jgi:lipid A 3-O-deacylase
VAIVSALVGMNVQTLALDKIIDEFRLGIYDHNSNLFASRHETSKPDINVEVLLRLPSWLKCIYSPKINLGANINTGNGTSIAYTGLTWNYNFSKSYFIEGSFGGAIHNGRKVSQIASRLNLNCHMMFHENTSIGYHISTYSNLMLTIDHMSNASLCSPNPGLTDIGVRYSFIF